MRKYHIFLVALITGISLFWVGVTPILAAGEKGVKLQLKVLSSCTIYNSKELSSEYLEFLEPNDVREIKDLYMAKDSFLMAKVDEGWIKVAKKDQDRKFVEINCNLRLDFENSQLKQIDEEVFAFELTKTTQKWLKWIQDNLNGYFKIRIKLDQKVVVGEPIPLNELDNTMVKFELKKSDQVKGNARISFYPITEKSDYFSKLVLEADLKTGVAIKDIIQKSTLNDNTNTIAKSTPRKAPKKGEEKGKNGRRKESLFKEAPLFPLDFNSITSEGRINQAIRPKFYTPFPEDKLIQIESILIKDKSTNKIKPSKITANDLELRIDFENLADLKTFLESVPITWKDPNTLQLPVVLKSSNYGDFKCDLFFSTKAEGKKSFPCFFVGEYEYDSQKKHYIGKFKPGGGFAPIKDVISPKISFPNPGIPISSPLLDFGKGTITFKTSKSIESLSNLRVNISSFNYEDINFDLIPPYKWPWEGIDIANIIIIVIIITISWCFWQRYESQKWPFGSTKPKPKDNTSEHPEEEKPEYDSKDDGINKLHELEMYKINMEEEKLQLASEIRELKRKNQQLAPALEEVRNLKEKNGELATKLEKLSKTQGELEQATTTIRQFEKSDKENKLTIEGKNTQIQQLEERLSTLEQAKESEIKELIKKVMREPLDEWGKNYIGQFIAKQKEMQFENVAPAVSAEVKLFIPQINTFCEKLEATRRGIEAFKEFFGKEDDNPEFYNELRGCLKINLDAFEQQLICLTNSIDGKDGKVYSTQSIYHDKNLLKSNNSRDIQKALSSWFFRQYIDFQLDCFYAIHQYLVCAIPIENNSLGQSSRYKILSNSLDRQMKMVTEKLNELNICPQEIIVYQDKLRDEKISRIKDDNNYEMVTGKPYSLDEKYDLAIVRISRMCYHDKNGERISTSGARFKVLNNRKG